MRQLAITALLLLAAAPAAHAATATVIERKCVPDTCVDLLSVEAAPGEANRMTLTLEPGRIVARDDGAPLTARSGCTQLDEHQVACRADVETQVLTGDGDDIVRSDHFDTALGPGDDVFEGHNARGDAGNDVLRATGGFGAILEGGEGDDQLVGGSADDSLIGDGGRDELSGGEGDDTLDPADGAADRVDGGAGRDHVDYGRGGGVSVDLADPAGDGAPGEGDALSGIEDILGGPGDDHLAGDDGANLLRGGPGSDVLDGRGGADELDGGYAAPGKTWRDVLRGGDGADSLAIDTPGVLDAGAGDDFLVTTSEAHGGRAACGAGTDRPLLGGRGLVRVDADCEIVRFRSPGSGFEALTDLLVHRGAVVLLVTCSRFVRAPCRMAAEARAPGSRRRLARRARLIARGGRAYFRLAVRGRRRVVLTLTAAGTPPPDYKPAVARAVVSLR